MTSGRGWRVGHQGRDQMYYEEWHEGAWQRLEVDGEMLMGPAHHVIYFASPERWRSYPAWARDRRREIIARITSEFRPPEYEYHGLDAGPGPVAPTAPTESTSAPRPPGHVGRNPSEPSGARSLLLVVMLLVAVSVATGWLAFRGARSGATTLPVPKASVRRTVLQQEDPAMFWASVGIYAVVSAGTLVLAAFGLRAHRRMKG
jgi:hypothetical protein